MFPYRAATESPLQNRYRVLRPLGRGGMGAVYEALDLRLERTVALKETLAETEDLRRAFEREARLLANLRHPSLPKVLDHFEERDGLFLVMEFIPGDDLGRMLDEGRSFPPGEVLRYADQLLDALEYLHSLETPVVHRDIKPSNLKLISPGQVVLLDFGIAKGAAGQLAYTTRSVPGYSPTYSPLEQMQGAGTDLRSDLYSLGATLYHLLTGVRPPDALTRANAVVNGHADPLQQPARQSDRQVSPAVSAALMRAMALNIEHRPASASEMRKELHGTSARVADTVPVTDADDITRITSARDRRAPSSAATRAVRGRQQVVIPVPTREEALARRRGGAGLKWGAAAFALVALLGAVSALAYFLFFADRKPGRDEMPSTAQRAPMADVTSTGNVNLSANANVGPDELDRQPPPGPTELAAREKLLQKGFTYDEESFARAVRAGDESAVELFFRAGMEPNVKGADGRPAILSAASKGDDDITRKLLLRGADANAGDPEGSTALMEAASRAHKNTVKVLLESGADVNLKDREGRTALMRAAAEGHGDVVKMLLERGAQADIRDPQGRDAQAWAEANGHSGAANLLRKVRRRAQ